MWYACYERGAVYHSMLSVFTMGAHLVYLVGHRLPAEDLASEFPRLVDDQLSSVSILYFRKYNQVGVCAIIQAAFEAL